MHFKIDEETLKQVIEITEIDYGITGNIVEPDTVEAMLDDLISEYKSKELKLKELEQEIENNYELKVIDPYEEYGLSRKDFI